MLASTPLPAPRRASQPLLSKVSDGDATGHTRIYLMLNLYRSARLTRHMRDCQTCTHPDTLGSCQTALRMADNADNALEEAERWAAIRDTPAAAVDTGPLMLF